MHEEADQEAVSLFVVSGVRIYREGLVAALDREPGVHVVNSSNCSSEALTQIFAASPDVILVDTASCADPQFVPTIRRDVPSARLVAFGITEGDDEIVACAEAGYAAYVKRDATLAELADVVRLAHRGELLCSFRVAATLFKRLGGLPALPARPADALTGRERTVLVLIRDGLSNKEIADRLGISCATVKNHVHNVLEKLHVNRRVHAATIDVYRSSEVGSSNPYFHGPYGLVRMARRIASTGSESTGPVTPATQAHSVPDVASHKGD
jgi:two-component system, NarL family, nitrate/nitrite response regulator NarL